MKIKYSEKKNTKIFQINFYQKDNEKKYESKKDLFWNFKIEKKLNKRRFILFVRKIVKMAKHKKLEDFSIDYEQFKKIEVENLSDLDRAKILIENLYLAEYKYDKFFSEKKGRIKSILVFGKISKQEKKVFKEAEISSDGLIFTRNISNAPGNILTPTNLAVEVRKKFKNLKNTKVKILEDKQTQKMKMGLYNSVGAGSEEKSKFVIVEYFGDKKSSKSPIVLVGKAVTFDTGGLSLKPSKAMKGMNMDMAGGASVLGALYTLASLGVKKNVVALVPAVENAISAKATRVGDVIKSMSGKTVEIGNTDAEGRLILADAITYAKKYKPEYMIDVATLTGASLVALGERASAVMTNNKDFEEQICKIGEDVGDYFWPLPVWDEYLENMKSDIADFSNNSNVPWGGTITAGVFLKQFAKEHGEKIKWAHIDMAPRMEAISCDLLEKGATGEPMRALVEIVKSR